MQDKLYPLEMVKQIQVLFKFLLLHKDFINFKSLERISKVIILEHEFSHDILLFKCKCFYLKNKNKENLIDFHIYVCFYKHFELANHFKKQYNKFKFSCKCDGNRFLIYLIPY